MNGCSAAGHCLGLHVIEQVIRRYMGPQSNT